MLHCGGRVPLYEKLSFCGKPLIPRFVLLLNKSTKKKKKFLKDSHECGKPALSPGKSCDGNAFQPVFGISGTSVTVLVRDVRLSAFLSHKMREGNGSFITHL